MILVKKYIAPNGRANKNGQEKFKRLFDYQMNAANIRLIFVSMVIIKWGFQNTFDE